MVSCCVLFVWTVWKYSTVIDFHFTFKDIQILFLFDFTPLSCVARYSRCVLHCNLWSFCTALYKCHSGECSIQVLFAAYNIVHIITHSYMYRAILYLNVQLVLYSTLALCMLHYVWSVAVGVTLVQTYTFSLQRWCIYCYQILPVFKYV